MNWIEVTIRIEKETEELVTSILNDLGYLSLSIKDPYYLKDIEQNPKDWDYIDLDKINLENIEMSVSLYIEEDEDVESKIEEIKRNLYSHKEIDKEIHKISTKIVKEEDWSETWKEFYKPTRVGNNIVIKPSWEEYIPEKEDIVVEIDPGMAFGTGTHETTNMCIAAMEKYLKSNHNVIDIGTGSGILSIVAGKLGASKVTGVDLDDKAVKVAKENVLKNNLSEIVEIKKGDLFKDLNLKGDLIVANIIADIIIDMSEDVKKRLNPGGIFISSGILLEKKNDVIKKLEKDFKILEIIDAGEWSCIVCKG